MLHDSAIAAAHSLLCSIRDFVTEFYLLVTSVFWYAIILVFWYAFILICRDYFCYKVNVRLVIATGYVLPVPHKCSDVSKSINI